MEERRKKEKKIEQFHPVLFGFEFFLQLHIYENCVGVGVVCVLVWVWHVCGCVCVWWCSGGGVVEARVIKQN